jgi:hypothetical protein
VGNSADSEVDFGCGRKGWKAEKEQSLSAQAALEVPEARSKTRSVRSPLGSVSVFCLGLSSFPCGGRGREREREEGEESASRVAYQVAEQELRSADGVLRRKGEKLAELCKYTDSRAVFLHSPTFESTQ